MAHNHPNQKLIEEIKPKNTKPIKRQPEVSTAATLLLCIISFSDESG